MKYDKDYLKRRAEYRNEEFGEYYIDESFDWVDALMLIAVGLALSVALIEVIGPDRILSWI